MCMCETTFEVTALALFCLAYHVLTVLPLLSHENRGIREIVGLVYAGGSAVIALLLLLGAMGSSKKLVDLFVLCAKIRLLLYCLLAGFMIFQISTTSGNQGRNFIDTASIPFIVDMLTRRLAMGAQEKVTVQVDQKVYLLATLISILADAFVIYRVQLFSESKLGPG